jgi:hypothetical protein
VAYSVLYAHGKALARGLSGIRGRSRGLVRAGESVVEWLRGWKLDRSNLRIRGPILLSASQASSRLCFPADSYLNKRSRFR